ncbi:hypothetical protein BDM02DRAFT_3106868 [Thelephora ganbajun]|uniref:Uncharacterized protein n=1 Tax=Thelephora ganbajun TaxID=370292 RepID=A0ACB6ZXE6_THEGA|nr:hypothetical protein BDM02DRAFT_3106868 [Thelephora ganbajun]
MSQHSNLELVFRTPQEIQSSKTTLDQWKNDQARIGALQTLSVRSRNRKPDGLAYQDLINSLIKFFESGKSRLPSFQTLKWEVDKEFPPSLLRIFETNHPSWTIHLHNTPDSIAVLSSPAVTSLTVELRQEYISENKAALSNVQSAIQSLKTLKRLHLYVNVHGCAHYSYSTDFPENGGTFPPLEELVLEWFKITQKGGEYWLRAMDWSHLRVLDFREGSISTPFLLLLLPIADKLPALESLGLNLPFWKEEDVRDQRNDPHSSFSLTRQLFLTAQPQSLRDVRIQGYYRSLLPDILDRHGASLKSLSLHETETSSQNNQRIPLSLEELQEIWTKSTGLEGLALDVNISKGHKWPENIVGTIASSRFSSLGKLTVFSLIGISGEMIQQPNGERGFAPATTEEDARSLSSSLSATPLKEITVRIGEERTIRGRPAYFVLWENNNRKVLTMSREKDGWVLSSIRTGHEI